MMPMDFPDQPESRLLAGLTAYEPDRQCSDKIRTRCHAALLTKRKRAMPVEVRSWRLVFECSTVAVACVVYVLEVARRALSLYGF